MAGKAKPIISNFTDDSASKCTKCVKPSFEYWNIFEIVNFVKIRNIQQVWFCHDSLSKKWTWFSFSNNLWFMDGVAFIVDYYIKYLKYVSHVYVLSFIPLHESYLLDSNVLWQIYIKLKISWLRNLLLFNNKLIYVV